MDINNDKTVYKLITWVLLIVSSLSICIAAVSGGLKAALFAGWLIFIGIVFWIIIGVSITNKPLLSGFRNVWVRCLGGVFDFFIYRFLIMFLAVVIIIMSVGVWAYLGKSFPSIGHSPAIVSEIPSPLDD